MRKKIFYISFIIFLILAAIGWLGYVYIYPDYKIWRFQQDVLNMTKEIENYLANDTYGGKTPEETYALYIEALKRGDTETASKYFYWERQVGQKEKLDELKNKGELEKYIADLPKWSDLKEEEYWDKDERLYSWIEILKEPVSTKLPDGAGGFIEHTFQPGPYKQEITFWLNRQANIWKIYSL